MSHASIGRDRSIAADQCNHRPGSTEQLAYLSRTTEATRQRRLPRCARPANRARLDERFLREGGKPIFHVILADPRLLKRVWELLGASGVNDEWGLCRFTPLVRDKGNRMSTRTVV
jgi:hypothetical protein